jgi:hypothetical protein
MHKALAGAVLALTVVGVVDAAAIDRRVRVNNETSYDIVRFYASNTGTNSWEEDILGEDILPAGYSVTINIDDGSGYCKYDFLAIFEDGDQVEAHDKNVCELSEFSFTD